jgi:archaeal flagellar protein FlaJ
MARDSLFFYSIGGLIPKGARERFRHLLSYAGREEDPQHWWGRVIFSSLLLGGLFLVVVKYVLALSSLFVWASAPIGFAVGILLFYLSVYAKVEDRRKRVEKILPDQLQMVAANIRSGLTPVVALRTAARPEFGILEEEIKFATTKSLGTENITDALKEMSKRIDSEVFERVVSLFSASLKSGGKLARLLESTAEDIRKSQDLKAELVTSTKMYVLFVLFVVIVGTPVLLAISLQFIDMITRLQSGTAATAEAGMAALGGIGINISLSKTFLLQMSYFILVANGILSSVLVGVIQEGRPMSGLRYSAFVIAATLGIFYVVQTYILRSFLTFA